MASGVTTNKFASNFGAKMYKHNPDTTAATILTINTTTFIWVPLALYTNFAVMVLNHLCTSASGPTLLEIMAGIDSSGTSPTVIVASPTLASITQGDSMILECTSEQVEEVGKAASLAFTHMSVRITTSNSGDEQGVLLCRWGAKAPQSGLTANSIT